MLYPEDSTQWEQLSPFTLFCFKRCSINKVYYLLFPNIYHVNMEDVVVMTLLLRVIREHLHAPNFRPITSCFIHCALITSTHQREDTNLLTTDSFHGLSNSVFRSLQVSLT